MSDPTPDIPADMVERAAREFAHTPWDRAPDDLKNSIRHMATRVLTAALAGRVLVALPDPRSRDEDDDPLWVIPGGGLVVACVIEGQPFVVSDPPSFKPVADRVEAYALRLLAAAREARRLAAEGGDPT